MTKTDDPDKAAAALGLDRLDLQTAHEAVEGTLTFRSSACGTRLEVRYVAADPFPSKSYWPGDGSKGALSGDVGSPGIPVAVGASGVRELGVGDSGATHSYQPPPGQTPSEWRRHLRGFESWRNGEVFGVVTETYAVRAREGRMVQMDVDANWGCLDFDSALEIVQEGVDVAPAPGLR